MATMSSNNNTSSSKTGNVAAPSLNVYKQLTIVRRPGDAVAYEDSQGAVKSLSIQDLGDAIAAATPLVNQKPKTDIPVPQINVVSSYEKDVPATYDISRSYVRYHKQTEKEWRGGVDYVADAEDESWLENNSKFGGRQADDGQKLQQRLPIDYFERMLDLMEKATAFEAIITVHQAESMILGKLSGLLDVFPLKGRGIVTFKHVVNDVYAYWVSKRSKLKRPLLRHYWPVTSSEDTNPHLVFRPREKEKYKLRKKRQNDMEAFHKMKQLRNDFDNLRALLELVRRREELFLTHVQFQIELFQQRLYDAVDTSGVPRVSEHLGKEQLKRVLDVPVHFDLQFDGRRAKRVRPDMDESTKSSLVHPARSASAADASRRASTSTTMESRNIAGIRNGEPAPNFLHPLETRETCATSWDNSVPYVASYVNSHALPTFHFRHRPRIGRGGRVCIDRLPVPLHSSIPSRTVFRAGLPMPHSLTNQERLLDLLPDPLDHAALSRRIEDISAHAVREDYEAKVMAGEENDGDEVIVRLEDWIETDDPIWGEERYAIGPI